MDSDSEYTKELLIIKRNRLRNLEKKAAFYGIDCPTHIGMEIEELCHEIKKLESTVVSIEQRSNEENFRNDLIEKEKSQLLEIISNNIYSQEFLEKFITNKGEMPNLKLMALDYYFESGFSDIHFFQKLIKDFNQDIRKFVIQNIRKFQIDIDEDTLKSIILDPSTSQEVITHTVKLAYDLAKTKRISIDLFSLERIFNNSYWLIKADAISGIIAADSPDSIKTLSLFHKTKYWKSRRKIAQYFNDLCESKRITDEDIVIAKKILQGYIADEESSDITMKKMQEVLDKLSQLEDHG